MTDWLFSKKALAAGAVVLVGAVALGIFSRTSTLGNVASVVGLAVSVVGFIVTIWTVLDAQQQIEQSADRAEQAVAQTREEARRAVEGIANQLLAADCAALRTAIEDLRQAAQDGKWPRAVYRCQEGRVVAYRLALDRRLTREEMTALRETAEDLRFVLRFVEKNRLSGQSGPLQEGHVERIDAMIALLAQIQARLHHQPLRPGEVPPDNP